jgi:hypothetical protein
MHAPGQKTNRHITEATGLRGGGTWAPKANNLDRVRHSAGLQYGEPTRRIPYEGAGSVAYRSNWNFAEEHEPTVRSFPRETYNGELRSV